MASVEAVNFLKSLEEEILHHEAVHHPFLKRFATEPTSIAQIQTFGLQHYQLVKVFVNYMTNLLPKIPDQDAAALFRKVFDDEFGQATVFRSHPALYRNFLRGLGLPDEAWGRVQLIPETASFIEGHLTLTRDADFLVSLGAIGPAHEFSIPTMFAYIVEGIRKNTGLAEKDFEYFTLHIIEDKEHAKVFNALIERHVATVENQKRLREGVLLSLNHRRRFWDGLLRTVFG
ncbi:MAG TPA: iron-containing redox enzyme family protein [Nitrospiria bacterium]|nr:iron-containing redox enzyme family protein [Nitrospiria bacterium]